MLIKFKRKKLWPTIYLVSYVRLSPPSTMVIKIRGIHNGGNYTEPLAQEIGGLKVCLGIHSFTMLIAKSMFWK